jgi:orotate phosphoribosyltransferase
MNSEQILSIFKKTGALLDGHFRLTSGLHSAQYFQCAKVLQYPEYATMLCGEIADSYRNDRIAAVVAPALGGIVVGQEVGRQLNVRTMFTERKDGVMQLRRGFEINAGERVLVCEDVVTTGGSVAEVVRIVKARGGFIAGVGYVVDRSGGKIRFEVPEPSRQVALLHMNVETWSEDSCPLCAKGVPILKPGSREK